MHDAIVNVPTAVNEPILAYAPGSPERTRLQASLAAIEREVVEIPCVIGGQRVLTGKIREVVMPHRHKHVVARFHAATEEVAERAILAALDARREWAAMRWEARAAVLLRAAELLSTTWRMRLNAATMHGQSKTAHQAEIDSACELIVFWRFNVQFAADLYRIQPQSSAGVWNMTDLRPLEGFVFALTPFNFTAISGNLPMAPALMGNTVVWKPAETQLLAAWRVFELLEEAGLPPGVVNFIPGLPHGSTNAVLDHPMLAGIHFTGSTDVFRMMWKRVAENIDRYKSYPRLVGETGGKDFILAHRSADPAALATAIVRGGYEFQGQKCSAASRVYVARSVWDRMREPLIDTIKSLKLGDVSNFSNFMGAVIKQTALDKHPTAAAPDPPHQVAQARRRPQLPQLHGRGHQADRVRQAPGRDLRGARDPGYEGRRRRHLRRPRGLARSPDAHHHRGPQRAPHARRVLRPDRHPACLSRQRVARHPPARRSHLALRPHRLDLRPRPRRDRRGHHPAAP